MSNSLKKESSQVDLKQKSLMGWFKPGNTPSTPQNNASKSKPSGLKASGTKAKAVPPPVTSAASTSSVRSQTELVPDSDNDSVERGPVKTPITPARGSSVGAVPDTPPASDAVDTNMESSDMEEMRSTKSVKASAKRKVIEDEDTDEDMPVKRAPRAAQSKKQRIYAAISDDDDDDVDEDEAKSIKSASQRLTRFRKSPVKKSTKRRTSAQVSDDDDFVVSDTHNSPSPGPSRSSSRASQHDSTSGFSDASEDDAPAKQKPAKAKKTALARPSLKPIASGNGGSNSTFLTAAEQRAQSNKDEKKDKEDAFEFLQDVRDKDGVRPGEPGYDPRTLYIPKRAWASFTPFEKQFWEIKQNHFDTVLFFQKGKFYELYEDDARIGHQQFDLKLTQRVKMSMVGVPEMSFNMWASKFLAKGYKVGCVSQAETALGAEMRMAADKEKGRKKPAEDKGKDKIVRRELNKVYTNGTLVDPELLTDEQAGHIISVVELTQESESSNETHKFGLCILDCSTSEFNLAAFEDDVCRTRLETALRQLRVKEVLFTKGNLTIETTRLLKAVLPGSCIWTSLRQQEGLSFEATKAELSQMFGPSSDGVHKDDNSSGSIPEAISSMLGDEEAVVALGSMIWYLRQLNIDKDIVSMRNFNIYDPMKTGDNLTLDGQTLAHVEVLMNSDGTDEGSLLKLLGRCITPFGKRLFRIWLCSPLHNVAAINDRLDVVQDLIDNPSLEADFTDVAKGLPDLERIVSRIHAKSCKVKDFIKVLKSFEKLNKGMETMSESADSIGSTKLSGLLRSSPDLRQYIKNIRSLYKVIEDDGELTPVPGKDSEYDGIMAKISKLETKLDEELVKLEDDVGTKLEYWHSAQGTKEIYMVQVKASFKAVPKTWTKSGATKAVTRWSVPALAQTIRSLKESRETRNGVIKAYKHRVFAEFDADRAAWLQAIRILAELDCLFSLYKSSVALGEPSCRPEFVDGDAAFIDFEELRHPALTVSSGLKGDFIPNDVKLGGEVGRMILLTGPNMGGKSTAMRMTATGVIMAQLGMMVPAKSARLCPVDNILTRMGAYDNMFSNASTFKVELDESCKILREATPRSLVILDELGRGTSTYDGMAIAGAVLHELVTHTQCLGFFATHYSSLTDDFAHVPGVRNMHMQTMVDDEKRELVFLYKLVKGIATSSFGTHVARLAGVPEPVVERADAVSADFVRQFAERINGRKQTAATRFPLSAQADFAYLWRVASGVQDLPDHQARKDHVLEGIMGAMRGLLLKS